MNDRQPPLYLITGIVVGVLLGLFLSYFIFPIRYVNTEPATLSDSQKTIYRDLVARSYLYEADLGRAFSRLALLKDVNSASSLVQQAQQVVAAGEDPTAARGLALLASAYTQPNLQITPLSISTPIPSVVIELTPAILATKTPVQPTVTPFATFTPRPTATAKPTQSSPYKLASQKEICDNSAQNDQLMIYVFSPAGDGVAGVKIEVSLPNGGSSSFYTGFYPEINPGYADFEMLQGETYQVRVGEAGEIISGIKPPQCTGSGGQSFTGGLELKFKQQ
jgi:hypothetical protein